MKNNVKTVALAGTLAALTLVLGLTPIGIIPIPPANVTLMCLPVIIGALTVSPKIGVLLGAIFGATSTFRAFTAPSALVAPLLGASPVYVVIMSVVARLLVPIIAYLVYKAISKTGRKKVAVGVAAAVGSLTNTVFYLAFMLLFYALAGLDAAAVLGVIAGVGALNGSLEAVAAVLICTPVVLAVNKVREKSNTVIGR